MEEIDLVEKNDVEKVLWVFLKKLVDMMCLKEGIIFWSVDIGFFILFLKVDIKVKW